MSEIVQPQDSLENEPVTEVNYKKALKRLTRLEKVVFVIKLFVCLYDALFFSKTPF
jgi:cell division protein FtsL